MTHVNEPTEDEIQREAYLIWLENGRPKDRALDHWLEARELLRHLARPKDETGHDPLHFTPPAAHKPRPPKKAAKA